MELKISKLRIVILGIWALFMGKMGEFHRVYLFYC